MQLPHSEQENPGFANFLGAYSSLTRGTSFTGRTTASSTSSGKRLPFII